MKCGAGLGLALAAAFSVAPLWAAQSVRVQIGRPGDLETLRRGGFDLVKAATDGEVRVILHSAEDRRRLDQTGLTYRMDVDSLEAFFARRLAARRDDMGGYMTLSELEARLAALHDNFPELVGEPVSIGRTVNDREVWAVKVSDHPDEDEDEPEALFTALIHAREVITPEVLFGFVEHLVRNYGGEEDLTRLVDERQLWFIMCVNPDGYAYNEDYAPDGGGMWRKNRRRNPDGSYGVDLNRNFGYQWGYDDEGSSPIPSRETYRGPEAFSEAETQAIREFVNDRRFTVSVFLHSYGDLCLYPWGYDYIQAPDRSVLAALAGKMTEGNGYLPGTGWEVIYPTNGDSDDWLYGSEEHSPVMAFTIEVGTEADDFWPPLQRVRPLVEENLPALTALAEFADRPERISAPPKVGEVTAVLGRDGVPVVSWTPERNQANPPRAYNIRAVIPGDPLVDDSPENQDRWSLLNFSHSVVDAHSEPLSYRVQTTQDAAFLTLRGEIIAPDTIYAWVNWNLSTALNHYLALEVSEDGWAWAALAGERTRELVINRHSLGHGLTGASGDWVRTWWQSGAWAGRTVKLRFRYYKFGRRLNNEFCFIDDIGPLSRFRWTEVAAGAWEDTVFADRERQVEEGLAYQVQAVDGEGDISFWSEPAAVGAPKVQFELAVAQGWNLVSVPLEPDDPAPAVLFRDWVQSGVLRTLKNGAGAVFAPELNFNQIPVWNPVEGYYLLATRDAQLEVKGRLVEVDCPVPLGAGWNLVAYLPEEPLPVAEALASVEGNLSVVKNGWGQFWAVQYRFDNLRRLEPGQGYYLRMEAADTLVYPARGQDRFGRRLRRVEAAAKVHSPESHLVLVRLAPQTPAGEVIIADARGRVLARQWAGGGGGQVGMALWGTAGGVAGLKEGESFRVRWRSGGGAEEVPVEVGVETGELKFQANGFTVLTLGRGGVLARGAALFEARPNPFNAAVTFSYMVEQAGLVELRVMSGEGREVFHWEGFRGEGRHIYQWEAGRLASGVYIAELTVGSPEPSGVQRLKLLHLR